MKHNIFLHISVSLVPIFILKINEFDINNMFM